MNDTAEPLPPDELARRLTEVFDLVGPLYRLTQHSVERGAAAEGLSVTVRAVLDLLQRRGPLTVPSMGRTLAVSRQFVQRTVNEAAERGLVESVPNPAHRRSSLIRLTDAGRRAITAVLAREHGALRGTGGDLTDADVTACVRVLGELVRLMERGDGG
ncbi:MarR family transcriptional regulator [Streptomyces sp. KAU_LT]|uniref:MarR family winged helix-turn-helix transcriptional regulator n=1 Tax=Streptomyces sp. KAU_LT TaxID=3046669 RepID=UPI0024B67BFD|nr:MarR family transcriptional regulator [Streptomyces sp. KAU_LT]MDI9829817.1 MarR family transcriptional regulator [Streptomyces sp. KAU_LT]